MCEHNYDKYDTSNLNQEVDLWTVRSLQQTVWVIILLSSFSLPKKIRQPGSLLKTSSVFLSSSDLFFNEVAMFPDLSIKLHLISQEVMDNDGANHHSRRTKAKNIKIGLKM